MHDKKKSGEGKKKENNSHALILLLGAQPNPQPSRPRGYRISFWISILDNAGQNDCGKETFFVGCTKRKEKVAVIEDIKKMRTFDRPPLHRCEATLKGCSAARLRAEDQSGRCEERVFVPTEKDLKFDFEVS